MKKILVVIGAYALLDLTESVEKTMLGWLKQECDFLIDIVINDNIGQKYFREKILNKYISVNHKNMYFHTVQTNTPIPLYKAQNLSWNKFKNYDNYDYFVSSHEDLEMSSTKDLVNIIQEFDNQEIGTVLGWCNYRNAPSDQLMLTNKTNFFKLNGKPYELSIHEHPAYNFVVYSKKVFEFYDYKFVDIMDHSGPDTNVILMNYLLNYKCVYSGKALIIHNKSKKNKLGPHYGHLGFKIIDSKTGKNICLDDLVKSGLPYGYFLTGKASNGDYELDEKNIDKPKLLQWFKEKFFCQKTAFDYDGVQCNIIYSKHRQK